MIFIEITKRNSSRIEHVTFMVNKYVSRAAGPWSSSQNQMWTSLLERLYAGCFVWTSYHRLHFTPASSQVLAHKKHLKIHKWLLVVLIYIVPRHKSLDYFKEQWKQTIEVPFITVASKVLFSFCLDAYLSVDLIIVFTSCPSAQISLLLLHTI